MEHYTSEVVDDSKNMNRRYREQKNLIGTIDKVKSRQQQSELNIRKTYTPTRNYLHAKANLNSESGTNFHEKKQESKVSSSHLQST